jgi:hypothetical protein
MASQSWVNLLNAGAPWQTTNGTALATSAATATVSPQAPTGQDFVLPGQPGGLQWYAGMTLRIRARGSFNSAGTTSNATLFLACGVSGTLATTLTTTGAYTLGAGSLTGMCWRLDALLRCLAIGSTGNTLSCGGDVYVDQTAGSNAGNITTAAGVMLGMAETVTAFNTYTAGTALGLRGTLSAAFGTIQCNQFTVEQLC